MKKISPLAYRILYAFTLAYLTVSSTVFASSEATTTEPPLPRHLFIPSISYGKTPSKQGENTLEIQSKKYWFIFFLSSWNKTSADIVAFFNTQQEVLQKRNIGVIGLLSQQTEAEAKIWLEKMNPTFPIGFASLDTIDAFHNPSIPTLFFVGSHSEILQQMVMPSMDEVDTSFQKALLLTDF